MSTEMSLVPSAANSAVARLTADNPLVGNEITTRFNIVKLLDPRFDPNNTNAVQNQFIAASSGPAMTRYEYTAAEYANDHIRWNNIVPMGPDFLYDMNLSVEYEIKILVGNLPVGKSFKVDKAGKILGIPTGHSHNIFENGVFSFRPYPLHQASRSIVLRLNDKELQTLPRENLNARMEYWNPRKMAQDGSRCPHMRVNAQDGVSCKMRMTDDFTSGVGHATNGDFGNGVLVSCVGFPITRDNNGKDTVSKYDFEDNIEWRNQTCGYIIYAKFRENLLCEPLDYGDAARFRRIMWNLNNLDVSINIDSLLNMFYIDKCKFYETNCGTTIKVYGQEDCDYHNDWDQESYSWKALCNKSNWDIGFVTAPKLIYKVYTPIPGNEPKYSFFCPYTEYTLFKSMKANNVVVKRDEIFNEYFSNWRNNYAYTANERTIRSGEISLSYFPNRIYFYVAMSTDQRTESLENRIVNLDSYARITGIKCNYHNNTEICSSLKEDDLYEISLRNGLQGRTLLDWNACYKDMTGTATARFGAKTKYSTNIDFYTGIGSVVCLYPGLDMHTGNMSGRMIGGCKTDCRLISFEVKFRPLNIFNPSVEYQLYVLFEQEGACIMDKMICIVGLVGLKSVEAFDIASNSNSGLMYTFQPMLTNESSTLTGQGWFQKAAKSVGKAAKKGWQWIKKNHVIKDVWDNMVTDDYKKKHPNMDWVIHYSDEKMSGNKNTQTGGLIRKKRKFYY